MSATKLAKQQAESAGKLPPWDALNPKEQQQLLETVLQMIAEWRPVPKPMLKALPPALLEHLVAAVKELRSRGTAGPHFKASDRIKMLKHMLDARLPQAQGQTTDELIESLPREARAQIRAQEAQQMQESETSAIMAAKKQLAVANNPALL